MKKAIKDLSPLAPLPTGTPPSGRLSRPARCVLFDIYGTLFISGVGDIAVSGRPDHLAGGLSRLLDAHGLQGNVQKILDAFYAAIETDHKRKRETGSEFPEIDILRIWRQVLGDGLPGHFCLEGFAVDYELMANPVWPMPHLEKTLTALNHRGVVMGVVSNAQFYTPLLFEWFLGKPLAGLGFNPDLVFFSYRHGIAKPARELFQWAADRLQALGVPPSDALFVGNDVRNDMLPAAKTGFATALFAGDARSLRLRTDDAGCAGFQPDLVITDLNQLLLHV